MMTPCPVRQQGLCQGGTAQWIQGVDEVRQNAISGVRSTAVHGSGEVLQIGAAADDQKWKVGW